MKQTTLVFLRQQNKVLLAMKKRGFGVGKLNGVGGKVLSGESVAAAAIREAKEEIGVEISEADLERVGLIKFYFLNRDGWDQECNVFFTRVWKGVPTESEEMAPSWFDEDKMPFNKMWIDDRYWLPIVLSGEKIEADFHFDENGEEIKSYSIESSGIKEAV